MAYEVEGIKQIETNELQEIVNEGKADPILVDVREPEEYVEGHISNIPLIPMHNLPALIDQFDKDKEYIFVCRSGNRSQNVAMFFKERGFDKVSNYAGGMLAWDGELATGMERVITDVKELYK
ncbi:sulfurtransferase [Alkalihalophilus pseudofirmus]|uniref:rhodanese-like domain-containing protein n=1 Tax=Alkalihalobacterium alkalinitrilicum TaxID=427920 RepID=UPI00094DDD28|nr:rhodanese-like domain-containing protein [Alkalihalobacterium alkalinitrilicum]OLO40623.1 sulfurtransferase [Alkalihalophilus pseudofirmus]